LPIQDSELFERISRGLVDSWTKARLAERRTLCSVAPTESAVRLHMRSLLRVQKSWIAVEPFAIKTSHAFVSFRLVCRV